MQMVLEVKIYLRRWVPIEVLLSRGKTANRTGLEL